MTKIIITINLLLYKIEIKQADVKMLAILFVKCCQGREQCTEAQQNVLNLNFIKLI